MGSLRGSLLSKIFPKFKKVFMDARLRLGVDELISIEMKRCVKEEKII